MRGWGGAAAALCAALQLHAACRRAGARVLPRVSLTPRPRPCPVRRRADIVNWVWRYFTEPGYRQWIVWVSGVVQTALYADFFYYYSLAWKVNKRLQLPA